MSNNYICQYSRTPIGSYQGQLKDVSAPKLGAATIKDLLDKSNLNRELVDASAGATPYLKMFGLVMGGYYMAKAAIQAEERLQEDSEFYKEKITVSKFYMEQILPQALGLVPAIKAGKEDLFNIKSENY